MILQRFRPALACALLAMLAGCGGPPPSSEKQEPKKPEEPVTGQSALYQMYRAARGSWALDVKVLKLDSIHMADAVEVPGKSAAWEAVFMSPSLGAARSYTYSIVELLPDYHKGAFAWAVQTFSQSRGSDTPFLIAAVKIDTDAAYETAVAKAADDVKKNEGKRVMFVLEQSDRFPDPAWRIVWGDSVAASNLSVFVDASTGQFLEKVR